MPWISAASGGVRIQVRVQPRASRNELIGVDSDCLRVRLTAPPIDGEANRQLRKYLSELFCCSPGNIQIVRGLTGRLKLVEIAGVAESEVLMMVAMRVARP